MVDMSLSLLDAETSASSRPATPVIQRREALYIHQTPLAESHRISGGTIDVNFAPQISVPQTVTTQRTLSGSDYDISSALEEAVIGYIQTRDNEVLIDEIKEVVEELPIDVENFLRTNEMLISFVNEMLSTIYQRLRVTGGLPCSFVLSKWTDIEVPGMDCVEIVAKIAARDYNQLLAIWEMIDNEVYRDISSAISEKIVFTCELL